VLGSPHVLKSAYRPSALLSRHNISITVIGERMRAQDIDVNPAKGKLQLNVRMHSKDAAIRLTLPRQFNWIAVSFAALDDFVKVTPKNTPAEPRSECCALLRMKVRTAEHETRRGLIYHQHELCTCHGVVFCAMCKALSMSSLCALCFGTSHGPA
jgi:hypothetical protein